MPNNFLIVPALEELKLDVMSTSAKVFFVEKYWHTDNIQVVRQDSRGSQQLSENVEYDKLSSYMC